MQLATENPGTQSYMLEAADCELQATGYKAVQLATEHPGTQSYELEVAGCRLQATNAADDGKSCSTRLAGYRLQATGYKCS